MATKILKPVEKSIAVKITTARNPKEFYQDRKGLWVWNGFKSRVVEKAEEPKENSTYKLSSFELLKYATDEEIEKELPKKHVFKESNLCAFIAEMISEQPHGQSGVLLNNGNWNLFYTEGCVVHVYWYAARGVWRVFTWDRGGYGWRAGSRVFSPQLTLKLSKS